MFSRAVSHQTFSMLALTLLFKRVVAYDVAPLAFAIADDDFFDAQVVLDDSVSSRSRQALVSYLVTSPHLRALHIVVSART